MIIKNVSHHICMQIYYIYSIFYENISHSLFLMQKLEDDLLNSALKKSNHEGNLEKLNLSQKHIEQEVSRLQGFLVCLLLVVFYDWSFVPLL